MYVERHTRVGFAPASWLLALSGVDRQDCAKISIALPDSLVVMRCDLWDCCPSRGVPEGMRPQPREVVPDEIFLQ